MTTSIDMVESVILLIDEAFGNETIFAKSFVKSNELLVHDAAGDDDDVVFVAVCADNYYSYLWYSWFP